MKNTQTHVEKLLDKRSLNDQRYFSTLDNPSLDSLTQLINELANIEIKYLESQTDTLLKQIEIEKKRDANKDFWLKGRNYKIRKEKKDLSNDLNSLMSKVLMVFCTKRTNYYNLKKNL